MGNKAPDAPDVVGAANQEGYNARLLAQQETLANRPNQYGPQSTTEWTRVAYNPETGQRYDESTPDRGWDHDNNRSYGGYLAPGNREYRWEQTTRLRPEWQQQVNNQRHLINDQQHYRNAQGHEWYDNPIDSNYRSSTPSTIDRTALAQFGQTSPTTGANDWRQFGTTNPTTGAQDWRQFGTSDPTIGANQWQDLGYTNSTIGADDWRQFGNTERTINSGDFDSRFGSAGDHGYGDHDMSGGDWSLIQYEPEHIRRQAEQQTLDFMNSQLDPQWDQRLQDLEVKLANQGLQWGDAAYDNAMASLKRSRDTAYAGARNQALADSRAEAMMLWDQEMGRSEQKNRYTQADLDNEYRARQANISNALSGREQDMQGYLAYQQAAFDQDRLARQQQLDANLGYGREAYGQDLQSRQQALDAQLNYGRESWNQDFQSRQQQLDANRLYGQQAYDQDYNSRQQQLDANRMYGQQAFDQDYQARQQNISNYLNYGQQEFDQNMTREQFEAQQRQIREDQQQQRYQLMNPGESYDVVNSAMQG